MLYEFEELIVYFKHSKKYYISYFKKLNKKIINLKIKKSFNSIQKFPTSYNHFMLTFPELYRACGVL